MNSSGKLTSKRRLILILLILTIGFVALTIVSLSSRSSKLQDQFSWLTPAELNQIKRIDPLTRLKFHVMNWTAPLWKSYWRNRPQISISVRAFRLSPELKWINNSSAPFVTATNGTRVWILSPAQLKSIEAEIELAQVAAITAQSQIITAEEVAAQVSLGNSVGNGSNATFIGSTVFVFPTTANDKIVLPLDFSSTRLETNSISEAVTVKTNQAYACRAVFPNNGGLLIENPNPEPGSSNRHWLFLSARVWKSTKP